MAPIIKSPQMTLAELVQTPEFHALSVKQRFWVQTYIQTLVDGAVDPILATQSAYTTEGENARTMSYYVLRNKKVQGALRVFWNFGKAKRGVFIDDLKAEIEASRPGSAARERLISLYAQMVFGSTKWKKCKRSIPMKRPSAGHLPRAQGAPWNRSSALSPEVIAIINTATANAVDSAIRHFDHELGDVSLTDEQRGETIQRLVAGVTEGIAKAVESLKK
jgi:hypothetical protein